MKKPIHPSLKINKAESDRMQFSMLKQYLAYPPFSSSQRIGGWWMLKKKKMHQEKQILKEKNVKSPISECLPYHDPTHISNLHSRLKVESIGNRTCS